MAMEVRRVIAEAHEQPILCVAYNAQRREIFTGSQDTTIKAWLSETGELLRTQREHAGWVTGLTYAYLKEARTSVLFSCSVDGRILVWQKGELLQKEKVGDKATHGVQSGPLYCLEWDARRQNLVAGANGHIWVYTVVADSMNLAGQPIIKFHSLLRDAHSALQGEEPVRGQRPATCTPSTRTEWFGRLCLSSHPSPLTPQPHSTPPPSPSPSPPPSRSPVAGARHHLHRLR
jgi:WD40 repeat protein